MIGPTVTIVDRGGLGVKPVDANQPVFTVVAEGGYRVTIDEVNGLPVVLEGYNPDPPYDPDAQALFNRFDIEPTPERKQLISDRFVAGKATTWWTKLDALWLHAAHDEQAGRSNWLSSSFTCVRVNNPTFEIDRGFMSDGVSSYLDTQFNPFLGSTKFVRDSASFAIRSNTSNQSNTPLAGFWDGTKGTTINPRDAGDRMAGRINQSTVLNSANGASMDSIGMFLNSRMDASAFSMYRNGSPVASGSIPSTQIADGSIRLGGINDINRRICQFSMAAVGTGLTDAEAISLYNWFEVYRTALGII